MAYITGAQDIHDQPAHDRGQITDTADSLSIVRPTEVDHLCGDASKARDILGWTPKITFNQLADMVAAAVEYFMNNTEENTS